MSSEYSIEANNLGKCYHIYDKPKHRLLQMLFRGKRQYFKEFWALKDVSLKVKKGETIGIIGQNGSGKSTLLQMICGTLNPTLGEVKVKGRVAALLELGAGFNPEFTGVENIYMTASIYGLTKDQIMEKFETIEKFADIGPYINQPVKTYSSGMYVRLAFAVIANIDADILIIDEALAVGDAIFNQKCMRFIKTFQKKGTLLFVSHDTASILSLCNKALWIDSGKAFMAGDTKKVVDKYMEDCLKKVNNKISSKTFPQNQTPHISQKKKQRKENFKNFLESDVTFFSNIENSDSFLADGAEIVDVIFNAPKHITGGEEVDFKISINIKKNIQSLITGLLLKDKLGQSLLGLNTYNKKNVISASANEFIEVSFSFTLPSLADGKYFITVAIADGDMSFHEHHHWIHEAVIIEISSREKAYGLLRGKFNSIHFERIKNAS